VDMFGAAPDEIAVTAVGPTGVASKPSILTIGGTAGSR